MIILQEWNGVFQLHSLDIGNDNRLIMSCIGVQPRQYTIEYAARHDDHQYQTDDKRMFDQSRYKVTHFTSIFVDGPKSSKKTPIA